MKKYNLFTLLMLPTSSFALSQSDAIAWIQKGLVCQNKVSPAHYSVGGQLESWGIARNTENCDQLQSMGDYGLTNKLDITCDDPTSCLSGNLTYHLNSIPNPDDASVDCRVKTRFINNSTHVIYLQGSVQTKYQLNQNQDGSYSVAFPETSGNFAWGTTTNSWAIAESTTESGFVSFDAEMKGIPPHGFDLSKMSLDASMRITPTTNDTVDNAFIDTNGPFSKIKKNPSLPYKPIVVNGVVQKDTLTKDQLLDQYKLICTYSIFYPN